MSGQNLLLGFFFQLGMAKVDAFVELWLWNSLLCRDQHIMMPTFRAKEFPLSLCFAYVVIQNCPIAIRMQRVLMKYCRQMNTISYCLIVVQRRKDANVSCRDTSSYWIRHRGGCDEWWNSRTTSVKHGYRIRLKIKREKQIFECCGWRWGRLYVNFRFWVNAIWIPIWVGFPSETHWGIEKHVSSNFQTEFPRFFLAEISCRK